MHTLNWIGRHAAVNHHLKVPFHTRHMVLCNFDEFHVYDFETQMDSPVGTVALADLPEYYGPARLPLPRTAEADFRQRPRRRHPRSRQ